LFLNQKQVPAEQKHMNWHMEALNEAFVSVDALHYKYTKEEVKKVVEPEVANKKRGAYGLF
jgi:ABC-type uncharacterized transport system substrate-binding protein